MRSLKSLFSRPVRGGEFAGRRRTNDQLMTFDQTSMVMDHGLCGDNIPTHAGMRFGRPCDVYDSASGSTRTYDSTGAFLIGELERLDQTLHNPLAAVTWGRDIDLREDVTLADEVSSFTASTYGASGGLGAGNGIGNGKAWIGKNTSQITGIGVDIGKFVSPLRLWGTELKYTIPELESAAKLGRPIDVQKFQGMSLKHQMDIDEQVYIGDTSTGDQGLITNPNVTKTNVPAGAAGFTQWVSKSPDEILADINTALVSVWTASGFAIMSNRILLPPVQYGYISTAKVSNAGNVSIKKYIEDNNLLEQNGGAKLEILPLKWAIGAGAGGTIGTLNTVDRMIVYTKAYDKVRFPMTMLQRTPIQYDGIYHKTTYFCRLGVMEFVYPQTVGYFDQI